MDSGLLKVTATDYTLIPLDQKGKVYAHLDEEDIQAIAKAVCDEWLKRERERNSIALEWKEIDL
jgi:hypothetical protein